MWRLTIPSLVSEFSPPVLFTVAWPPLIMSRCICKTRLITGRLGSFLSHRAETLSPSNFWQAAPVPHCCAALATPALTQTLTCHAHRLQTTSTWHTCSSTTQCTEHTRGRCVGQTMAPYVGQRRTAQCRHMLGISGQASCLAFSWCCRVMHVSTEAACVVQVCKELHFRLPCPRRHNCWLHCPLSAGGGCA